MPFGLRKSAAVLCIAFAAFAAFMPAAALSAPITIYLAVWLVAPALSFVVIRIVESHVQEQTASLLRIVPSRAPPLERLVA
jgi:hypothetical protein